MKRALMLLVVLSGCGSQERAGIEAPDASHAVDLMLDSASSSSDLAGADFAGQTLDLTSTTPDDLASSPDMAHVGGLVDMAHAGGPVDMTACGAVGEPCCAAYSCTQADTVCRVVGTADPGTLPSSTSTNYCRNCGQQGQACCAGSTCSGSIPCFAHTGSSSICGA